MARTRGPISAISTASQVGGRGEGSAMASIIATFTLNSALGGFRYSAPGSWGFPLALALFHYAEEIAFGVADPHKPEVVVGHASDDVGLLVNGNTFSLQRCHQPGNVAGSEIDERACAMLFRALSAGEIQANAATIEERHVGRIEQQAEAEDIAVKRGCAVDLLRGDGNLQNSRELRAHVHFASILLATTAIGSGPR